MPRKKGQTKNDWPDPLEIMELDISPGAKQLLRLRLTQLAAAQLVGVSELHMGNIVRGKSKASRELRRKIKDVLGFDPIECRAWKEARDEKAKE